MTKMQFDPLYIPTRALPTTRAQVTLSFDWLPFAVKLQIIEHLPRMPTNQMSCGRQRVPWKRARADYCQGWACLCLCRFLYCSPLLVGPPPLVLSLLLSLLSCNSVWCPDPHADWEWWNGVWDWALGRHRPSRAHSTHDLGTITCTSCFGKLRHNYKLNLRCTLQVISDKKFNKLRLTVYTSW